VKLKYNEQEFQNTLNKLSVFTMAVLIFLSSIESESFDNKDKKGEGTPFHGRGC